MLLTIDLPGEAEEALKDKARAAGVRVSARRARSTMLLRGRAGAFPGKRPVPGGELADGVFVGGHGVAKMAKSLLQSAAQRRNSELRC
jgi:hypothetical protein